jgi:hypothetical protein
VFALCSGIYTSPQAAYAAAYNTGELTQYPAKLNEQKEWVLIASQLMIGLPYPVTRTDYPPQGATPASDWHSNLYGKAMNKFYDVYYVTVDPANYFEATEDQYIGCTAPIPDIDSAAAAGGAGAASAQDSAMGLRKLYEELVVREEAQLVPRFFVYFTEANKVRVPPPTPAPAAAAAATAAAPAADGFVAVDLPAPTAETPGGPPAATSTASIAAAVASAAAAPAAVATTAAAPAAQAPPS